MRRQQGVIAGRQARHAGQINAVAGQDAAIAAVEAVDRRHAAVEIRVDRKYRRLAAGCIVGQHVLGATRARREFVGEQRTAAGQIEERGRARR
ncbi:MAG: hypothetical protein ACHQIO_12380, partial [Nevskiales bacterium]